MPKSTNSEDVWITINGKAHNVNADEKIDDKTREKLPSLSGQKEKNTKEAISKEYTKRYNIKKSIFNIRDEVVFDEYKKSGIISGLDGKNVRIFDGRDISVIGKDMVFKKSELLDDIHWDTMTNKYRLLTIEKTGIDQEYISRDWMDISPNIRKVMQKIASPAGYDSATSGNSNPIYNPVNENKTVSRRIKEEEEKQSEPNTNEKGSSD